MTTVATPIEDRLDRLTEHVAALTAELERERNARARWSELASDATPIAAAALERLGAELEGAELSSEEIVALLRDLAVAVPDLRAAVRQLSSLADLARTIAPMGAPVMRTVTDAAGRLDERGYLDFVRGTAGVLDKVVGAFGEDDIDSLGDNVVLILETVKEMTQPEVMQMLQRTLHNVQDDESVDPPSLFAIARELREPAVRRGLDRMISALRSLGTAHTAIPPTTSEKGAR